MVDHCQVRSQEQHQQARAADDVDRSNDDDDDGEEEGIQESTMSRARTSPHYVFRRSESRASRVESN